MRQHSLVLGRTVQVSQEGSGLHRKNGAEETKLHYNMRNNALSFDNFKAFFGKINLSELMIRYIISVLT